MEFEERLALASEGDGQALAEIWRAYQPLMLRYFRGRLPDVAEDLASAVWIDVARSMSAFDGDEDGFRGWLFTIAHRRLVDEHRRRERQPARADGEPPDTVAGDDVEAEAFSLDGALSLVRRLPADQAEAVLLRVVADLDVTAVADIMHRSEGSVRVLVHRGLQRLATLCQKPVTDESSRAMNGVS